MSSRVRIAKARVFDLISEMAASGKVAQGVVDEGRIFDLGFFQITDDLHDRAFSTVHGLKDQVGQPFERQPWAYTMNVQEPGSDNAKGLTLVGYVVPADDHSVTVTKYAAVDGNLILAEIFEFVHSGKGFLARQAYSLRFPNDRHAGMAPTCYPLALAILNTRGCDVERQEVPKRQSSSRARKRKLTRPSHYRVNAGEYLAALRAPSIPSGTRAEGSSHASPIPHLRRAHERVLASGKRVWVRSALVNVRREGDLAFVERRQGYKKH